MCHHYETTELAELDPIAEEEPDEEPTEEPDPATTPADD